MTENEIKELHPHWSVRYVRYGDLFHRVRVEGYYKSIVGYHVYIRRWSDGKFYRRRPYDVYTLETAKEEIENNERYVYGFYGNDVFVRKDND